MAKDDLEGSHAFLSERKRENTRSLSDQCHIRSRIAYHYIKMFGSVSDVLHGCAINYIYGSRSEYKTSSGTSITSEVRKDMNVWIICKFSSKAVNLIHFHQCMTHSHSRGDCIQLYLRKYCSPEQPTKDASPAWSRLIKCSTY
jgi:hypothetical protein